MLTELEIGVGLMQWVYQAWAQFKSTFSGNAFIELQGFSASCRLTCCPYGHVFRTEGKRRKASMLAVDIQAISYRLWLKTVLLDAIGHTKPELSSKAPQQ